MIIILYYPDAKKSGPTYAQNICPSACTVLLHNTDIRRWDRSLWGNRFGWRGVTSVSFFCGSPERWTIDAYGNAPMFEPIQ